MTKANGQVPQLPNGCAGDRRGSARIALGRRSRPLSRQLRIEAAEDRDSRGSDAGEPPSQDRAQPARPCTGGAGTGGGPARAPTAAAVAAEGPDGRTALRAGWRGLPPAARVKVAVEAGDGRLGEEWSGEGWSRR